MGERRSYLNEILAIYLEQIETTALCWEEDGVRTVVYPTFISRYVFIGPSSVLVERDIESG